jgi:hypothetical protein
MNKFIFGGYKSQNQLFRLLSALIPELDYSNMKRKERRESKWF